MIIQRFRTDLQYSSVKRRRKGDDSTVYRYPEPGAGRVSVDVASAGGAAVCGDFVALNSSKVMEAVKPGHLWLFRASLQSRTMRRTPVIKDIESIQ